MQIFLYDWWPLRRLGKIYESLSRMPVELRLRRADPHPQAKNEESYSPLGHVFSALKPLRYPNARFPDVKSGPNQRCRGFSQGRCPGGIYG